MNWITDRVRLARLQAGRWATVPLVVRGLLLAAGAVTLALATPRPLLLGRGLPVIVAGGLLVAVAPRGRLVTALLLTATVGWLVSTIGFTERITAARLLGLAAAMYLTHTLAAFAAVLPYDAVVPPGVLAGWLLRAGVVTGCCTAVGMGALVVRVPGSGGAGFLVASIAGVVVAAALVRALTRGLRR